RTRPSLRRGTGRDRRPETGGSSGISFPAVDRHPQMDLGSLARPSVDLGAATDPLHPAPDRVLQSPAVVGDGFEVEAAPKVGHEDLYPLIGHFSVDRHLARPRVLGGV